MRFEWDEAKAVANIVKRGISFEEAVTVFNDPLYVDFYDPRHSQVEHRYIIIGKSKNGVMLIVSYTERGEIIRPISARKLTPRERYDYEEG